MLVNGSVAAELHAVASPTTGSQLARPTSGLQGATSTAGSSHAVSYTGRGSSSPTIPRLSGPPSFSGSHQQQQQHSSTAGGALDDLITLAQPQGETVRHPPNVDDESQEDFENVGM